jgi:hypothetical protein
VWLVHGEPPAQEALGAALRAAGYPVEIPHAGDRAPL